MKNAVLNKSLNFILTYKHYTPEETQRLKYGLEGIYLTITKLIIIFFLSIILKIFKEVIILLFLFNILRYFGFGFHAKKSSECLISSIICFIGLPLLLLNITLSKYLIIIIGVLCIIILSIFAPADTNKRPFPKTKKKLFRKIMTIIIATIYLIISLYTTNKELSVLLFSSIIIQTILVNPITYIIFKQPYNNYKKLVV